MHVVEHVSFMVDEDNYMVWYRHTKYTLISNHMDRVIED